MLGYFLTCHTDRTGALSAVQGGMTPPRDRSAWKPARDCRLTDQRTCLPATGS